MDKRQAFYRKIWRRARVVPDDRSRPPDACVLFDRDETILRQLRRNRLTILVLPAEEFRKLGDLRYAINPLDRMSFQTLVEKLRGEGIRIGSVVYLWALPVHAGTTGTSFASHLQHTFYPVFFLAQAFMVSRHAELQLLYLYEPDDAFSACSAAMASFFRVVRKEHPRYLFRSIGISPFHRVSIGQLIENEIGSNHPHECEVRYEVGGAGRHVKCLEEFDPTRSPGDSPGLRHRGTYVITGGMGGIGRSIARMLRGRYRANVILVGRSELPERPDLLLDGQLQPDPALRYVRADVSSASGVETLLGGIRRMGLEVNGVIHCAGVVRDAFIIRKSQDEIAQVFAPKVAGSVHICDAFDKLDVDFCALFSSISAEEGHLGQSDYAYANSFMDQLALRREKVLSINWSLWEDGGMKMPEVIRNKIMRETQMVPITCEDGFDMFEKVLTSSEKSVVATCKKQAEPVSSWKVNQAGPISGPAPRSR